VKLSPNVIPQGAKKLKGEGKKAKEHPEGVRSSVLVSCRPLLWDLRKWLPIGQYLINFKDAGGFATCFSDPIMLLHAWPFL
jgi:hypothetical protein